MSDETPPTESPETPDEEPASAALPSGAGGAERQRERPMEPDRRDERVATLLAVEPLDEVTRRRLVRTAVASAPSRRPRLALVAPVAAAIVVGLVVGAVLVNRPDDPTPTAAPATTAGPEPRAAGDGVPNEAVAAPPALGDLGDVTDPATLRQSLATARESEAADKAASSSGGCSTTPPPEAGAVVATATGTFDGEPVVIVVGVGTTEGELAFVLRSDDCSVLQRVPLVPA